MGVTVIVATWVGLSACVVIGAGAATDLKERFLTEAPAAWARMEQESNRLHVEVSIETWYRTREPTDDRTRERTERVSLIVKARDGMVLQERREIDAEGALTKGNVKAVNSDESFILTCTGGEPWVIRHLGRPDDEGVTSRIESYGRAMLMWPWHISNWSFPKICRSPGFHLKTVAPVESGGVQLAQVSFEYAPREEERNFVRGGWVLLDPRRSWCIVEYEVRLEYPLGDRAVARCKNFFADDGRGAVRPVRAELHQETVEADRRFTDRMQFLRYEHRTVPVSEFTLDAYGIHLRSATSRGRLVGLLFSAGILAVVIAVFLRRRYRKARCLEQGY